MNRKALYKLLGRYLNNTCTEAERRLVDQWLDLLEDNRSFSGYSTDDLSAIHNKIWKKIQQETHLAAPFKEPAQRRGVLLRYSRWLVAACSAGILILGGFYLTRTSVKSHLANETHAPSVIPGVGMLQQKNSSDSAITLLLEESSRIVLEPGSALTYPVHFASNRREVYLEGKAFFNVSKDAQNPFFIYHNRLVTHVIGTSFFIDTRKPGKMVEVSVLTGRVEVSEDARFLSSKTNERGNGVVLTPNQKVIYSEDNRLFNASIADQPVPLKEKPAKDFQFEEASMADVLTRLSSAYGIDIVVENDGIYNCTFTGDIASQDLYAKLAVICQSINCSYEIKGITILVKGQGCN